MPNDNNFKNNKLNSSNYSLTSSFPKDSFKILVTDSTVWIPKLYEIANVLQNSDPGQMPREKLKEKITDVDALFCLLRDKIDKEILDAAKNLKVVATMSVGYEHIDIAECKKRGIKIGYTPEVLTESTAELGVGLLLATSRRIPEAASSAKEGGWQAWTPYYMCGKALANSTVGIYGMGKIGSSIADKLSPFKPRRIIYHNRKPISGENATKYAYVAFDDLLKESDFLIISASSTQENRKVFDKKAFSLMKHDSILINISRGTIVNTNDLYEALKNGYIGAAGLDVVDPEPLPTDHPLFTLSNCVIVPHIGSATFSTRNQMVSLTEDNIYNFLSNKPMACELVI